MTEPTDKELEAFAVEEQFLLFCDADEFTQIARAVLAKWGTPAPVGVEPVAWRVRRHDAPNYWIVFLHYPVDAMADPEREVQPLFATQQPAQPQAGAVPLTDEMASKAGRALSDLYATECGVDKEDNWKVYGPDFIDTARLVLEAVGIKGGQHGADTDN